MKKKTLLIYLALAATALAPLPAQPPVAIPILEEDRPTDFHKVASGPWDGNWVLRSSAGADDVERVVYFCSDALAGECHGTEFVAEVPIQPARQTPARSECKGKCGSHVKLKQSNYLEGCRDDTDCSADTLLNLCDQSRGVTSRRASETCQATGGTNCLGYAATKVLASKKRCKQGALGSYCKYKCSAQSKGTCGAGF